MLARAWYVLAVLWAVLTISIVATGDEWPAAAFWVLSARAACGADAAAVVYLLCRVRDRAAGLANAAAAVLTRCNPR